MLAVSLQITNICGITHTKTTPWTPMSVVACVHMVCHWAFWNSWWHLTMGDPSMTGRCNIFHPLPRPVLNRHTTAAELIGIRCAIQPLLLLGCSQMGALQHTLHAMAAELVGICCNIQPRLPLCSLWQGTPWHALHTWTAELIGMSSIIGCLWAA